MTEPVPIVDATLKAAAVTCTSCGGSVAEGASFCPTCGMAVTTTGALFTARPSVHAAAFSDSGSGAPAGQRTASPAATDRPSYWPTILISFFFGIFGLIPAIRHSKMAKRRGYKQNGYWIAFGSSLGACILLAVVVPVVLLLTLAHSISTTAAGYTTSPAAHAGSSGLSGGSQSDQNGGSSSQSFGQSGSSATSVPLSQLEYEAQQLQKVVAEYPTQVTALSAIHPATLAALRANPADPAADAQAISQIAAGLHVSSSQALQDLIAIGKLPPSVFQVLQWAPQVEQAVQNGELAPG